MQSKTNMSSSEFHRQQGSFTRTIKLNEDVYPIGFNITVVLNSSKTENGIPMRMVDYTLYRKIPKISPYLYNPLQIYALQTCNAKDPPLNRPSD